MNNKMKLLMLFVGIVNLYNVKGETFNFEKQLRCGKWEPVKTCKDTYVGGEGVKEMRCTTTKTQKHQCEDVRFAIGFSKDTTINIPELTNVNFPETDGISICFWYKISNHYVGFNSVALYGSPSIPQDNDLLIGFIKDKLYVFMKSEPIITLQNLPVNTLTHLCWTWDSSGNWTTYMNGTTELSGKASSSKFKGRFPQSTGSVLLGQDRDNANTIDDASQAFHGIITQFYMYHKKLSGEEVSSVFKNKMPREDLVAGWWQFKGKTAGDDIFETEYPF